MDADQHEQAADSRQQPSDSSRDVSADATRAVRAARERSERIHQITVGDRGRVVLPAEVRQALGITSGTRLMLQVEERCIRVQTLDQALDDLRRAFEGHDPVGELLAERRREAERENAEMAEWMGGPHARQTTAASSPPDAA